MRFLVVIPVRMASTRLPGKPLADIAGEPMITHEDEVAERAKRVIRLRDGLIESDTRQEPVAARIIDWA